MQWVRDAYLTRYGSQDIRTIRGLDRELTAVEKTFFQRALAEQLRAEVEPLPDPSGKPA